MSTRSFFFGLVLSLFALSPAFAQEVRITTPQNVQVGDEITLTIQVLDANGEPNIEAVPEVSFSPEDAAEEISLYNCVDFGDKDNCQPNNRDVEGIYESFLLVNEMPLTVEVSVDGKTSSVRLGSGGTSTPEVVSDPVVSTPETPASTPTSPAAQGSVAPSQVQVGPQPSFWLIILPFLLMASVVGYFVIKTE